MAFKSAVIRVLIQKGTVKILLQTPSGGKGAGKKRENFEKFIREVIEELDSKAGISQEELKEMKQNLIIKQVSSLRYFIVQTENDTLIGYYNSIPSTENNDVYVFRVDPSKQFGMCYLSDFGRVFDSGKTIQKIQNIIGS